MVIVAKFTFVIYFSMHLFLTAILLDTTSSNCSVCIQAGIICYYCVQILMLVVTKNQSVWIRCKAIVIVNFYPSCSLGIVIGLLFEIIKGFWISCMLGGNRKFLRNSRNFFTFDLSVKILFFDRLLSISSLIVLMFCEII